MNTSTPAVRWLEWQLAHGQQTDQYVVEQLQALINTAQHAIKDIQAGNTANMEDFAFSALSNSLANAHQALVRHNIIKHALEQVKQYEDRCNTPVVSVQSA